jgi:hypothetical protein
VCTDQRSSSFSASEKERKSDRVGTIGPLHRAVVVNDGRCARGGQPAPNIRRVAKLIESANAGQFPGVRLAL